MDRTDVNVNGTRVSEYRAEGTMEGWIASFVRKSPEPSDRSALRPSLGNLAISIGLPSDRYRTDRTDGGGPCPGAALSATVGSRWSGPQPGDSLSATRGCDDCPYSHENEGRRLWHGRGRVLEVV